MREELQKKHGIAKFKEVLIRNKNLSKKAVNYWCLVYVSNDRKLILIIAHSLSGCRLDRLIIKS